MTENKPVDLTSFNSDRMAQLTREFNTHKGFGMQGALEAAESAFAFPPDNTGAEPTPATAPASAEPDPKQFEQILSPINTSLQEFKQSQMQELQSIRDQMADLRTSRQQAQTESPVVQPALQADGTPAPAPQQDPYAAKFHELEQKQFKIHAQMQYDRARQALDAAKAKYPDVDLSENDLKALWDNYKIGDNPNNLSTAERTNWTGHWEQVAAAKAAPTWQKRMKELEAENAQLKSNKPSVLEQLGAVPAGSRGRNAMANTPAVVEGPDGTDNDIYNYANERMSKGAFRGFGRLLNEGKLRKQLQGAM
jgi:hypothetical protein